MDRPGEIGIIRIVRKAISVTLLIAGISYMSGQRRGAFVAGPGSRPHFDSNHSEGHGQSHDRDRSLGVVAVPVYVGVDAGWPPAAATEGPSQPPVVAQPPPVPPAYPSGNPMPVQRQEVSHAPPSPPDPPYVLIALKNGWIYSAIAYWVEGRTLHYLTFEMVQKEVQLDLVDRKISARLNRDSEIEFKLPPE
jgi:hypothetical protein